MAPEWLRFSKKEKGKEFTLTPQLLENFVSARVIDGNIGDDPEIRKRLLYYAHLPEGAMERFDVRPSADKLSVDVVTRGGGTSVVAATFGIGEAFIYFINKEAEPYKQIHKFKRKDQIRNLDDFNTAIRDLILEEPKEEEIIDVSKKTSLEKMDKSMDKLSPQLSSIIDIKRGTHK